jgi:hypothetical protein
MKSDEVKLDLRLKSPLLQTYKIIHDRSLSYLGTETSIKRSLVLPRHFLLKFLYQDRKVSGHVKVLGESILFLSVILFMYM